MEIVREEDDSDLHPAYLFFSSANISAIIVSLVVRQLSRPPCFIPSTRFLDSFFLCYPLSSLLLSHAGRWIKFSSLG